MQNRFYNATTGRFIQRDPIGFDGGHSNLYSYVGNETVSKIDPIGLIDPHYIWASAKIMEAGVGYGFLREAGTLISGIDSEIIYGNLLRNKINLTQAVLKVMRLLNPATKRLMLQTFGIKFGSITCATTSTGSFGAAAVFFGKWIALPLAAGAAGYGGGYLLDKYAPNNPLSRGAFSTFSNIMNWYYGISSRLGPVDVGNIPGDTSFRVRRNGQKIYQ
jgi:uncharacterized protein RhaS with RHS repeats